MHACMIDKQLRNRFQEIYDRKYNPNTKGFDYEKILGEFLQGYLGGAFNFQLRVGIIDNEMKVNSVFKKTENEFDIVATYKNATPKIVYQRLIPYDSVAFIIEAKQTLKLDKKHLINDLEKFDKLNNLIVATHRVSGQYPAVSNPFKLNRPLRILFYYEQKADVNKFFNILVQFRKAWDLCIILDENRIVLNSTLPYFQHIIRKRYPKAKTASLIGHPLLKGMFFASTFVESNFVNSWTLFGNLFRVEQQSQEIHSP
jgi:hypothetical protein